MEETYKIRKDKVKNIAIIFLSVMLILTFFSNSILNRSLPEVATAYVEYGSITEKVRGNGVVQAQDPYKIVASESRTIESVPIVEGDQVTKGQVLFYLEDAESDELETAENELNDLILKYTSALLSGDISNDAYHAIQSGNLDSVATYQMQIEAARQKVKDCQATVDSIKRQQLVIDNDIDSDDSVDLEEAQAKRDEASSAMTAAQTKITSAEAAITAALQNDSSSSYSGVESLKSAVDSKKIDLETAKNSYKSEKDAILGSSNSTQEEISGYFESGEYGLPTNLAAIKDACGSTNSTQFDNFKSAYTAYANAMDEYQALAGKLADYNEASSELVSAKNDYNEAEAKYKKYQKKAEKLNDNILEDKEENEEYKASLNISLADAEAALTKAKEEQEQLLTDISKELDLTNQNSIIAEKQEEVNKLREKATGATILSPVEGTILSVTKVAGEKTSIDEEIATIQVAGKDMSVSFSVTKEQAAKVNIGDIAELQNAWYYDDVRVVLSKIKPDKDNPGGNKLLEFTISGDVQNGESLGISLGQRAKDYDQVVPNSAIREDNNGKFVFVIQEKSTPFGNRYKARRVNVEVLASDEKNTAISGEIDSHAYVITTSNKPLSAGEQVRLAEN